VVDDATTVNGVVLEANHVRGFRGAPRPLSARANQLYPLVFSGVTDLTQSILGSSMYVYFRGSLGNTRDLRDHLIV
jgi:hypothetical protein